MKFYVICRTDSTHVHGHAPVKGKYVLATSREFNNQKSALDYADTINDSREPRVLLDVTDTGAIPS